jgi:hypothetical protein
MAILSSYTYYLREQTDAAVIIIALVLPRSIPLFPFYHLALSLSHYEYPMDERLVPVSRVDYQNIILCARHCYCCCYLIDIIVAVVDKGGKRIFVPASKRIEMNFESPSYVVN